MSFYQAYSYDFVYPEHQNLICLLFHILLMKSVGSAACRACRVCGNTNTSVTVSIFRILMNSHVPVPKVLNTIQTQWAN